MDATSVRDFLKNITQVELALCYLGRSPLRKEARESMWRLAVSSFEELVGDGDEWVEFTAKVIGTVACGPKRRRELLDEAWEVYQRARIRLARRYIRRIREEGLV